MEGAATAPAAVSLVNAIPAGRGAAVAIDCGITARVRLDPEASTVTATSGDDRVDDTSLIQRCVRATTDAYGDGEGGHVETTAAVPAAVGLKTSSAAANATIAATLDALGRWTGTAPIEAARLGVAVAREVGVTVTGAFDDAAASMLGGLVVTDNQTDRLLAHRPLEGGVVIVVPSAPAPTAEVDVAALEAVAPLADLAADLVLDGQTDLGMAVNGLAVASALELDFTPMRAARAETVAVSPSGTGPAIAAIADTEGCERVAAAWAGHGEVIETVLRQSGVQLVN